VKNAIGEQAGAPPRLHRDSRITKIATLSGDPREARVTEERRWTPSRRLFVFDPIAR
jgi:hypothetical protein